MRTRGVEHVEQEAFAVDVAIIRVRPPRATDQQADKKGSTGLRPRVVGLHS